MPNAQVDCLEDFSGTTGDPIPSDWSAVTGGVFRGAAGAKVDLMGVDIRITKDLTIIADGDLTIDGHIELNDRGDPSVFPLVEPTSEPNINLISLTGSVIVTKGSEVGPVSASQRGRDSELSNGFGDAIAGDALDAGYIRIKGVSIEIAGFVRGISGGDGGNATQDRTSAAGAFKAVFDFLNIFQSARADGGRGGRGGDLVLCALEGIKIPASGDVVGGFGGTGGFAKAVADAGAHATANGGHCGDAGNVIINGMQPGCQILHDGDLAGGTGGWPVKPSAVAGGGTGTVGGDATARGSNAGAGGTVIFNANCVLKGRGVIEAGDGPPGGDAEATGGNGGQISAPPSSVFNGEGGSGGDATAEGGAGALAGATPAVPLDPFFPPTLTNGRARNTGGGGRASATPGDGGNAAPTPGGMKAGGNSGAGEARGGPNGSGQGRATPVKTSAARPAKATPQTGALGTPAVQAGVP